MAFDLILNDHSYLPRAETVNDAQQRMRYLLDTIREISKRGIKVALRMHAALDHQELAPNYTISRWRNDQTVERELRTRYRNLATQNPLLKAEEQSIADDGWLEEFHYAGQPVPTLGLAYHLNGLGLSFASHPCWDESLLQLEYTYLASNELVTTGTVPLAHACHPRHISDHAALIDTFIRQSQRDIQYMRANQAEPYINAQEPPPRWQIAFAHEFAATWDNLDGLARLRIVDAINDLQQDPMTPRYTTIKRLTGDLAGFWRYRIGEFRLRYHPRPEAKTVMLLAYRPRGGAYDD